MSEKYDKKYDLSHAHIEKSAVGDNPVAYNYEQGAGDAAQTVDIEALFKQLENRLSQLPAFKQTLLQPVLAETEKKVQAIQTTAEQKAEVPEEDQSFLQERLLNIYAMSEDIGEVLITTLANPALGVALVIQKVAKKALAQVRGE